MEKAKSKNVKVHLPVDFVCGDKFAADATTKEADLSTGVPADMMGLDCGSKSAEIFCEAIKRSRTIIWNGPAGVFEFDKFANCTKAMAEAIAEVTKQGATTVVGGGDTATAVLKLGYGSKVCLKRKIAIDCLFNILLTFILLIKQVSHVSTGGGSTLELLELYPKLLPGVEYLSDN